VRVEEVLVNIIEQLLNQIILLDERKKPKYALDIKGCSNEEIEALRLCQCVKRLPSTYKLFMQKMGGFTRYIAAEWNITYDAVATLKQEVIAYYDCQSHDLDNAFIFAGYNDVERFRYFHTEVADENPPIFLFGKDLQQPIKEYDTFTSFLEAELEKIKQLE
jgi:hypothetical protein